MSFLRIKDLCERLLLDAEIMKKYGYVAMNGFSHFSLTFFLLFIECGHVLNTL